MSNYSSLIGQDFAFAHGRIGTLQQRLLTQSDIDRLLGAQGSNIVEDIFTELKITDGIDQGIHDGDAILLAIEKWIRIEVEEMTPESKRDIFNIIWIDGDAPLLSFLLKKYHSFNSEISCEPESGISAFSPDKLRLLVEENIASDLPNTLVQFVQKIKGMNNPSPKKIDTSVAMFVASAKSKLAKSSKSKEILKFVQHSIDLNNIRTALRLLNEEAENPESFLLPGGLVPTKTLTESKKSIASAAQQYGLSYDLSEALSKDELNLSDIEKKLIEIMAKDISSMWNVPLSIEPVFAFASIAILQLRLMRMILIGKRNTLSPQDIKKALPPFLSASHY
ncbi:hypothetical protein HN512_03000 [Candidatus Peregrinibacteria bacterium]|mgnify:CR=1 FL=1|jgi:hypothetical protein|nr:hypothetical protein [Candidatus Peregrinibacteria bacterium]MBT3598780.1 hypothetical protein [Candidatus Peregrinibacteria bacterium]MBT4585848.1 hypothetical protein [Candidatus Peregrinibacteria bacterium]MBT6731210.1 hypothetical protein [Candidatus Peregrinibacteria bacterium]MBT7009250.1 hypothetical protein [Candidatus Peregrinibacteria bacterium]